MKKKKLLRRELQENLLGAGNALYPDLELRLHGNV